MKTNLKFGAIAVIVMVVGAISFSAFKPAALPPEDSHHVGDVVYSILSPEQFKQEHGDGWRIMNGAPFSPNDLIVKRYHVTLSPNACGVFIRGMNLGRDAATGDPDGNRAVGTPQADNFKAHHHMVGYPYGAYQFHGLFTTGGGPYQVDLQHNTSASKDVGANETRPKN